MLPANGAVLGGRRHGTSKGLTVDRLCWNRRSRHLLMNALNGIVIIVRGDEDDSCLANVSKPPRSLYAFAASLKIYIHQNNVGLIAHG